MYFKKNVKKFTVMAGIVSSIFASQTAFAGDFFDSAGGHHTAGVVNLLNLNLVHRGDLIVLHNPVGLYGYYTHSTIVNQPPVYIGGGQYYGTLIESNTSDATGSSNSIWIGDLSRVQRNYDNSRHMVISGKTTGEMGSIADQANYLLQNKNGPYDWNTGISSNSWYCSKLLYRAVNDSLGVQLKYFVSYLFLPDDVYTSYATKTIQYADSSSNTVAGLSTQTTFAISSDQSNQVTTEEANKIRSGKIILLKNDMPKILKNRVKLQEKLLKQANLPFEHKQEFIQEVKNDLDQFKAQVNLVKNDPQSKALNIKVYGNSVFNDLVKETEE